MARSNPTSAFRRLDFPTLGRPTNATRTPCSRLREAGSAATHSRTGPATSAHRSANTAQSSASSTSFGKSIRASTSARSSTSCRSSFATRRDRAPPSAECAARAARSDRDFTSAATASACARSIFPFRYARSVNSPGRAGRAPASTKEARIATGITAPPCEEISTTSSPV